MKLLDLINEEERNRKHDYGCVMLYFKFPNMFKIHRQIDPNDLYEEDEDNSFGLEDEPHVTLLYGLHDGVSTDDVVNILDKFSYGECQLHNPSLFQNDNYDVLKFDVRGNNLHETNKELIKHPHTTDFPEYHPHMTMAYLKPGKGEKYAKMLRKYSPFTITPTHAVYSKTDGTKDNIHINNDF